jgi:hypothetical protein
MKKFAIGCLIVLALLIVVGGVGLYFAYDRIIKPGIEMTAGIKELARLGEVEKQVRNTSPFAAPETGELTQAMIDRFVKVQQHMQAKLGPRMDQLKEKYDRLDRAMSGEKRQASFMEVATGLKDLAAILVDGKAAQVEALNDAAFSVKEYEWVRERVYAAVGMVAVGIDMKKMAAEARAGNVKGFSPPERGSVGDVPDRNKVLVAPYEKQLKDWAALAYFGL